MNSMEYSPSVDRPGCVTAYAVLAWFGAAAYICGALALAVSGLSDPEFTVFGLILALVIGVLSLLPILTGIGLWKMTMWGWWLVVVVNGLGVAGSLLNMLVAVLLGPQIGNVFSRITAGLEATPLPR